MGGGRGPRWRGDWRVVERRRNPAARIRRRPACGGEGRGSSSSDDVIAELRADVASSRVKRLAPVLPVLSRKGMRVPFTTCEEMLRHDAGQNTPLWKLAVEYEMARGDLTEAEVLAKMVEIVRILRRSIQQGIAGTQYDDRVLGHQCGKFNELMEAGRLLDGGALNRIVLYVTALMEVKSSMGVIVAAPTAGACAALPGAVIAMAEEMGLSEEDDGEGIAGQRPDRRIHRHALDICGGSGRVPGRRRCRRPAWPPPPLVDAGRAGRWRNRWRRLPWRCRA